MPDRAVQVPSVAGGHPPWQRPRPAQVSAGVCRRREGGRECRTTTAFEHCALLPSSRSNRWHPRRRSGSHCLQSSGSHSLCSFLTALSWPDLEEPGFMEVGYLDHKDFLRFHSDPESPPWVGEGGARVLGAGDKESQEHRADFPHGPEDPVWLLQLAPRILDFHAVSGSAWTIASQSVHNFIILAWAPSSV